MDVKGSIIDTNLKIFPSKKMVKFLESLSDLNDIPKNILSVIKGEACDIKKNENTLSNIVSLTSEDVTNLKNLKEAYLSLQLAKDTENSDEVVKTQLDSIKMKDTEKVQNKNEVVDKVILEKLKGPHLTTSDLDWLYVHLKKRKGDGEKNVPYLHTLLEGAHIQMPENEKIKRNPDLEARCVKLRAQQEAREYKKMTKSVDNVRMRFPDDSISYQLKQVNRQLIAIGQFIISIFAGFLFGFKGVEWMLGNLEFGFRLLLGVMCALVIALAEIYFLAKKLNEELNIPETVQLGGPVKFADDTLTPHTNSSSSKTAKEHQD